MLIGYYQKDKKKLPKKKAWERYQNLSEEKKREYGHEQYRNLSEGEKNKKLQYGCERYRNLPEDENQKLVEYRKNYSKMQKLIKTGRNVKNFYWIRYVGPWNI